MPRNWVQLSPGVVIPSLQQLTEDQKRRLHLTETWVIILIRTVPSVIKFRLEMSLRLEIKKKMLERSPRVKSVDFHLTNTWVVFGLYSGTLALHDYASNVPSPPPRHVFEHSRPPPSPSEPWNFCVPNTGFWQAVTISKLESSTITPWKKSKLSKPITILSDQSSYIRQNP